MFKNGLVPKSSYFGTMVQLVQESPTPCSSKFFQVRISWMMTTGFLRTTNLMISSSAFMTVIQPNSNFST